MAALAKAKEAAWRMSAAQSVNMVLGQLTTNEVLDQRILAAMLQVPRERFVPERLAGSAYVDEDLPLGCGHFLLSPLSFARMLKLADIRSADSVLDIGCGFGYSAAVAAHLAKSVVGCDTEETFVAAARGHLASLGLANARVEKIARLSDGHDGGAPYDVILIEGAVEAVPSGLQQMLSARGRLIAVERAAGNGGLVQGLGRLVEYVNRDGDIFRKASREMAVPPLPGFEAKKPFVL